jgi:hypothetical protein
MADYGFGIKDLRQAIENGAVEWQRHVLERMVERGVRRADVLSALTTGERIEDYPQDTPFPSALFLGRSGDRPLHIVVAYRADARVAYIITVYDPDLDHFESDFRTRRRQS